MYNEKIRQWAIDRNLQEEGDLTAQTFKTAEEISELIRAISKNDIGEIIDGIGDVYVTLIIGNMISYKYPDYIFKKSHADWYKVVRSSTSRINYIDRLSKDMVAILRHGYYKNNLENTIEDLKVIAMYYNLDIENCIISAYNEIKDRTGTIIGGSFVKEL